MNYGGIVLTKLSFYLALVLADDVAPQLCPLVQIWSLLAPKNQDGDGQNTNLRLESIFYLLEIKYLTEDYRNT